MADEQYKVFKLATELATNNQHIANQTDKIKGCKDVIKGFVERNAAIVDEMAVHTEDDNI